MRLKRFIILCISIGIPFLVSFSFEDYQTGVIELEEASLYFLNLPDGEATLIKTPQKGYYLINTASAYSKDALFDKLKHLHIKKIEGLFLTEETDQYAENAGAIIEEFEVSDLYLSNHSTLRSHYSELDVNLHLLKENDFINLESDLSVKVLATNSGGAMTLLLNYGETTILYMGIDDPVHDLMIQHHQLNPNIIKVANFGQGYSPSEELLQACDPHVGIVFHEKNELVNEDIINRLEQFWIDVYQLKQVGTTIVRMNKNDYEIIP